MTKGSKSAKTLNSKGEAQSRDGDSDSDNTAGNDTTMTDASNATVGNNTVMTNASEGTVGNSTVRSGDTANWTKGDSSANTPNTSGAKEDEPLWSDADDEVELAGCKLSQFVPGQQQFRTVFQPALDPDHVLKYLGEMSRSTAVSLLDSYTNSIHQPWLVNYPLVEGQ